MLHQRRHNAGREVGAGAIVHGAQPGQLEDVMNQPRRRGLAVRSRDHDAPLRQARGQLPRDVRGDGPSHTAGHRCAAPKAQRTAGNRSRLTQDDGGRETKSGRHCTCAIPLFHRQPL